MDDVFSRREFLRTSLVAGGALVGTALSSNDSIIGSSYAAGPIAASAPFPRAYEIKPLPFKPESLKGLSPTLMTSHHENNYGGAVKNLMKVEAEIAKLSPDAPAFVLTGLKQSEHAFRNSMVMHELYFENLGQGRKPSSKLERLLSAGWGSKARFELEFKTAGTGVGGGTGWVVLGWDLRTAQPIVSCLGHNNQFAAMSLPLLLMDVYEHAYAIDYGTKLKDYVEAFFANVNWDVVSKRLDRAEAISKSLGR